MRLRLVPPVRVEDVMSSSLPGVVEDVMPATKPPVSRTVVSLASRASAPALGAPLSASLSVPASAAPAPVVISSSAGEPTGSVDQLQPNQEGGESTIKQRGALSIALDELAGEIGTAPTLCLTLHPNEGDTIKRVRQAAASFCRRLLALDPHASLWLALSREDGVRLHYHGAISTVLHEDALRCLWLLATRGAARLGTSIFVEPPNEAKSYSRRPGLAGWLHYSAKGIDGAAVVVGRYKVFWRFAAAVAGYVVPRCCAWCLSPFSGRRKDAQHCRRSCMLSAGRAERARGRPPMTSFPSGRDRAGAKGGQTMTSFATEPLDEGAPDTTDVPRAEGVQEHDDHEKATGRLSGANGAANGPVNTTERPLA